MVYEGQSDLAIRVFSVSGWFSPVIHCITPKLTHPLLLIKYIIDNLAASRLREFPLKLRFFYGLAKG